MLGVLKSRWNRMVVQEMKKIERSGRNEEKRDSGLSFLFSTFFLFAVSDSPLSRLLLVLLKSVGPLVWC